MDARDAIIDHDPVTGEVTGDTELAADNRPVPRKAVTISQTLGLLEDGQFDADASALLRELIGKMEAHAFTNRGVSKGKISIELDLTLANGAFTVVPSIKRKIPEPKHLGTVMFAHEDGSLSRNPPGQGALFGVRAVEDTRQTRTV